MTVRPLNTGSRNDFKNKLFTVLGLSPNKTNGNF